MAKWRIVKKSYATPAGRAVSPVEINNQQLFSATSGNFDVSTFRRFDVSAHRRGFNLVELLMALAITAALLAATMVALNASYIAYQQTTRAASTHTISRLAMDRMLTLIRTGEEFGPLPSNPNFPIVHSDLIEIVTMPDHNGVRQGIILEWVEADEALWVRLFNPETGTITASHVLLEGVVAQYDGGQRIKPFTLEFEFGRHLHRATIDLSVIPDDNLSLDVEGAQEYMIRLVATAMPRLSAYVQD